MMWRTAAKVGAATLLFAGIHSALASRAAKQKAVSIAGQRRRNALYRPFFIAQSLATFGGLAWYASRLPNRVLYEVPQPYATLMHAARAAALGYATLAAHHVGIKRMLGLEGLSAWLKKAHAVPAEPEAQGPSLSPEGKMRATGPFQTSRHPLNFSPLPVFWLAPKMTVTWAAFTLVATAYLALGSAHEEKRLREAYGRAYEEYQRGGVPFFVPSATVLLSER